MADPFDDQLEAAQREAFKNAHKVFERCGTDNAFIREGHVSDGQVFPIIDSAQKILDWFLAGRLFTCKHAPRGPMPLYVDIANPQVVCCQECWQFLEVAKALLPFVRESRCDVCKTEGSDHYHDAWFVIDYMTFYAGVCCECMEVSTEGGITRDKCKERNGRGQQPRLRDDGTY